MRLNPEQKIHIQLITEQNNFFIALPYPHPNDAPKKFELLATSTNRFISLELNIVITFLQTNINMCQINHWLAKRTYLSSMAKITALTGGDVKSTAPEIFEEKNSSSFVLTETMSATKKPLKGRFFTTNTAPDNVFICFKCFLNNTLRFKLGYMIQPGSD